jgi:hypothetical protein
MMSGVEREFAYRLPASPLRTLGFLLMLLAPTVVLSLHQPEMSDVQLRSRGIGTITLTPAQQPVAGWIFGAVILVVGLVLLRIARRPTQRPGRIAFTETSLLVSVPAEAGSELKIPYRQISEVSVEKHGRRSRLRFTCSHGHLEFPASRMESPEAFAELCRLLNERVQAARTKEPATA